MNTKHILQSASLALVLLHCLVLPGVESAAQAQDLYAPKPPVPEGYRLVEGDILIPLRPAAGDLVPAGTFQTTDFWPDGVVPYEWDDNVSAANRQMILNAMAVWEAVANVHFRPKEWWELLYYVHIQNSTENSSPVGRQLFNHTINIVNWNSTYIMVHELGHTLGFWHEQSRLDRDAYVQVNYGNIQGGETYNFDKESHSSHYGPYDFDSVMHYGRFAFSANGQPTISVLPPYDKQWQSGIGQRTHLSEWDARIMSFLYPYPNWRFVDQAAGNSTCSGIGAPAGTFLDPYNSFFCGLYNVPNGGTIWIQPGSYPAVGTYGTGAANKAMTFRAPLGGVTLR